MVFFLTSFKVIKAKLGESRVMLVVKVVVKVVVKFPIVLWFMVIVIRQLYLEFQ